MTDESKPRIHLDVADLFKGLAAAAKASSKTIKGSGETLRESRSLTAFDRLLVRAPVELELDGSAAQPSLEIEGDDNIVPLIESDTSADGRLSIRLRSPDGQGVSLALTRPVQVRLCHPPLSGIETHGHCHLRTASPLEGQDLELELHGSARAQLSLDVQRLQTELHGSCRVELAGKADQHQQRSLGSVRLDAGKLASRAAAVRLSGNARAALSVTETIKARLSGRSVLTVHGDAKITKRTSGKARILRAN